MQIFKLQADFEEKKILNQGFLFNILEEQNLFVGKNYLKIFTPSS